MLQAVALVLTTRSALAWYVRLDNEALRKEAEQILQDPTSLKKVMFVLLCTCNVCAGRCLTELMQVPAPSLHDEASKALSIIVPAYNEELRLPSTLEETLL